MRLRSVTVLVALLVLVPAQSSQANDLAGFKTVFANDVVYAGFGGMRDNGTGTMTVSGVSGRVTESYLYWHGPTNSADPDANSVVSFAGQSVTGTNIGLSSDNCWGFQNSQAYRAPVTSLVSGDGSYPLSGFVKGDGSVNVNGASLLVFFDDGNTSNNRDVVLFDGNDSNIPNPFDADGWNVSLSGINYGSGSASMDLHVSDGQAFDDDAVTLNEQELAPAGPLFDGNTVPGNEANSRSGLLWDIRQFDVTRFLAPGNNTLTLTSGQGGDCLSLIVAAVNLPAGAAPDQPPPTTPLTPPATPLTPPVASTGDAAGVENDSVTLRGSVRPGGLATTWFFEYGRTTSYGRRTPTQTIPATTAEVPVSAEVSDLDSNSTYHYRLVAQNAAGTVTGPDRVFDTRKTRLSDLPRPVLGRTANVDPVKGKVFVSVPRAGATRRLIEGPLAAAVPGLKGRTFIPLSEARQIPMGSLLDTRKGTVRVATARDRAARVQSARFLDGVFQVLQSRARKAKGLTELRLKGSSFSRCRTVGRGKGSRGSSVEALASAGRTIRRLRGSGRGRFRTRGRRSAATVRGTIWTVSDRCDGTLTTVTRGRVAVRDFRRKKTIIVRAGKKYLAR